jgi:hypothetical protein
MADPDSPGRPCRFPGTWCLLTLVAAEFEDVAVGVGDVEAWCVALRRYGEDETFVAE